MRAYDDPTADKAIGKICHKEKNRRERVKKQLFKDAVHKMAAACGLNVYITFINGKRAGRRKL